MAVYYFRNTGDVNWGTSSNWSLSDGGPADGTVPTSNDDAVFTINSGNCTINASARICLSLICTGYTGTLTMSNTLTIQGPTVTLGAGMTVAGTANLQINNTGTTLTSNGTIWYAGITFTGSNGFTTTLADNWTVGTVSWALNKIMNGSRLYILDAINGTTSGTMQGTTEWEIIGNCTWTSTTGAILRNNLTFNNTMSPDTITLSGTARYGGGTLTHVAGTIVSTGATLELSVSCSLDVAAVEWDKISCVNAITLTLLDDLDTIDFETGGSSTSINDNTLRISGDWTINGPNPITGTTQVILDGTGTWSGGGRFGINTEINTAGTITISGTLLFGSTRTLLYTAGTVVTTGATLSNDNSLAVFDTDGIIWDNVAFTGGVTVTLASNMDVDGLLTLGSGSSALTVNGFNIFLGGSLLIATTSNSGAAGTTKLIFDGTGTWTNVITGGGGLRLDTDINTAGTITIVGTVLYANRTLTYVTGTVVDGGSAALLATGFPTFDTDGMSWPSVQFGLGSTTHTFLSDFHVTGNVVITGVTGQVFSGAYTMYVGGDLDVRAFTGASTMSFVLNGTGTWIGANTLQANLEINTAGTITISGTVQWGSTTTRTLKYTAGTVVTTGSTLSIPPNTVGTVDISGITLETHSHGSNAVVTYASDLYCLHFSSQAGSANVINGSTIHISGNLTVNIGNFLGTTVMSLEGTGTWSGTGSVRSPLQFNTAGTITLSGSCSFGTSTLTYISGTVDSSGGALRIITSCSLDIAPVTWENFIMSGNTTITLLDDLNLVDLLVDDNAAVINGFTTNVSGNFEIDFSGTFFGTTHLKLIGTGTLTTWSTLGPSNFTIDTAGTITFVDSVSLGGTNFTVANGTIAFSGTSVLALSGTTINAPATTYSFVNLALAPGTITLASNIRITGNLTFPSNSTTTITGNNLYIGGGITITGNNQVISGTTNLVLEGTGTVSVTAGRINNNLEINTAGTITISALIYANGTLKYTSGTVVTTGSTVTVPQSAAVTLDTNGVTWNNFTFNGSTNTVTIVSKLTVNGILSCANGTISSTYTFNGAEVQCAWLALANPSSVAGTSTLRITQTVTSTGTSAGIRNTNVLFDPGAGNAVTIVSSGVQVTFGSNATSYNQLVQLVSGTLNVPSGAMVSVANAANAISSIDFPGVMFDVFSTQNGTVYLLSDLHVRTSINFGVSGNSTTVGKKIYCYGTANCVNNTSAFGNSELVLCGTGTWTSGGVTGYFNKNVTIDTPGVITMGSETRIQHSRLTYKRGKVVVPSGAIFEIAGTCEIVGADKIPFNIVQATGNVTTPTFIKVDKMFKGIADKPVTVRSTSTAQYNLGITGPMGVALHTKLSRANLRTGYYSANNNLSDGLMNGLMAYYKLDGSSGDLLGRSNGTDNIVTYVQGRAGECGSFNGTTSRITAPDAAWFKPTTGLTIAFWMKANANAALRYMVSKPLSTTGNNGWDVGTGNGANRIMFIGVGLGGGTGPVFAYFEHNANVYDDTWHHICYSYGSNLLTLYIDGVFATSWVTTGSLTTSSTNSLTIGAFSSTGNLAYTGLLDEVGLWDRGLSATEVTELYSNANDIRNYAGLWMPTLDSNGGNNTGQIIYGPIMHGGVPLGMTDIINGQMVGGSFLSGGFSNE